MPGSSAEPQPPLAADPDRLERILQLHLRALLGIRSRLDGIEQGMARIEEVLVESLEVPNDVAEDLAAAQAIRERTAAELNHERYGGGPRAPLASSRQSVGAAKGEAHVQTR